MKKIKTYMFVSFVIVFVSMIFVQCQTKIEYKQLSKSDNNGLKYEYVTNDPFDTRIYTLDNGLKVYLSKKADVPRIQTNIAIKAGSKMDPDNYSGLTYQLLRMLSKGTNNIGTIDWDSEKILLDEIEVLFEKYRNEKDEIARLDIYNEIDSLSYLSSKYVAANEIHKMLTAIGGIDINAHVDYDETVLRCNIPVNELERWLRLERERFDKLVVRSFHTDLASISEFYNNTLDNDNSKIEKALWENIFKEHPYRKPSIGSKSDLENPSIVAINKYWSDYYVANNMAICLTGDIDFEETIALVSKHFGSMKKKEDFKSFKTPKEEKITKSSTVEVFGPQAEKVVLGYRFDGAQSKEKLYLVLIDRLLKNDIAGLLDLNLVQKQKVLDVKTKMSVMKDYSVYNIEIFPKKGQTLDEAKNLILDEISMLKKGHFEKWLLEAAINDLKNQRALNLEGNMSRSRYLYKCFINERSWVDVVNEFQQLEEIGKRNIVEYAKKSFADNFIAVYKRQGTDVEVERIANHQLTPLVINIENQSQFYKEFSSFKPERIAPVFVDFEKEIITKNVASGVELSYVKNNSNDLFSLYYIIDVGRENNKLLPFALNYLPLLGTKQHTPSQLKQELYKHGLKLVGKSMDRYSYIQISGNKKSFEKGVQLLEHIMKEIEPNEEALTELKAKTIKVRNDDMHNLSKIENEGLMNYAKYGEKSPFTNVLSTAELQKIKASELTNLIKVMNYYKHSAYYYGSDDLEEVARVIDLHHKIGSSLQEYPKKGVYPELNFVEEKVFFVNHDMLQSGIIMITKIANYDKNIHAFSEVYATYFGQGLHSVVSQELRSAKGLAHDVYSKITIPEVSKRSHYAYIFASTSADKFENAASGMINLMNVVPVYSAQQFNDAKEAVLKEIESSQITKKNIYWSYFVNKDKGINYDVRKDIYEDVKAMNYDIFTANFNKYIIGNKYNFLVVGNKNSIDEIALQRLGEIQELEPAQLFNY